MAFLANYTLICGFDVTVKTADHTDLTPRGQKDRAVLALLALSSERRRTRLWLQERLWSASEPKKAGSSLRRVLSNIRSAFNGENVILTDKFGVALAPSVNVVREALSDPDDFLGAMLFDDPSFDEWGRAMAAEFSLARANLLTPATSTESRNDLKLRLEPILGGLSTDEITFNRTICSRLAERLLSLGSIDVWEGTTENDETSDIVVEVDSRALSKSWIVNVRLYTSAKRFFLWAGRADIPMSVDEADYESTTARFLNVVLSAILDRGGRRFKEMHFFNLQHAISLLFTGQPSRIETSENILLGLESMGADPAIVAGWRAFQRVTRQIEFGCENSELAEDGLQLADYAINQGASNPTALALAAHALVKLGDDAERGAYLADRALSIDESNPYALSVASHVRTLLGHVDESYRLSLNAATASRALFNEFIWDMQLSLACLGVGRLEDAFEAARKSHLGNMHYRPALRYLVALSLLLGKTEDALRYETRLRAIESDFDRTSLKHPGYPVDTLRSLGLEKLL